MFRIMVAAIGLDNSWGESVTAFLIREQELKYPSPKQSAVAVPQPLTGR